MNKISRRNAIGSAAASMVAGLTGTALAGKSTAATGGKAMPPLRTMTLEQFRSMTGSVSADEILSNLDCENFMECHRRIREETGIWIPELVPVFEKLDAIRSGAPL